jgi:hypothetical protein
MENFIRNTLVEDINYSLSLKEIVTRMSLEDIQNLRRRQILDMILQFYPNCNFKKRSGHKDHSPIGHFKLRWKNINEKMALWFGYLVARVLKFVA